jgi:hypothetical protein
VVNKDYVGGVKGKWGLTTIADGYTVSFGLMKSLKLIVVMNMLKHLKGQIPWYMTFILIKINMGLNLKI